MTKKFINNQNIMHAYSLETTHAGFQAHYHRQRSRL